MIPQEYISSFSFDQRLAPYDIQGSIAHVTMLSNQKIISQTDAKKIIHGLGAIAKDIKLGKKLPPAEDIHFAIEQELIRKIGEVAKKMHTARSRNDQVVLDLKLYLLYITDESLKKVRRAQKAILDCAIKNQEALMPGFTHLQHAQAVFFSHHILAYAWMLERDHQRLLDQRKRLEESPLGACALAGTSFPIDREATAKLLGFKQVTENSIDSVADRDFVTEFTFICSLIMVHLSRVAEEFIIWSNPEFNYVTLAEEYTSGSSIMPQKRNPDTLELLRGKTSRTIGSLVTLLTLLKAQPLAYNRDLQEDKVALFDAVDTTLISLEIAEGVFKTLQVNKKEMEESCEKGFLLATECADYLTRKGLPFRQAHPIVSKMVDQFLKDGSNFQNLTLKALKSFSPLFDEDFFKILSIRKSTELKNSYGGTGKKALAHQIKKLQSLLEK